MLLAIKEQETRVLWLDADCVLFPLGALLSAFSPVQRLPSHNYAAEVFVSQETHLITFIKILF